MCACGHIPTPHRRGEERERKQKDEEELKWPPRPATNTPSKDVSHLPGCCQT